METVKKFSQQKNVRTHGFATKYNIADRLTRSKGPIAINSESIWQNGPSFLELPENEWPIYKTLTKKQLPDLVRMASIVTKGSTENKKDTLASRINISKYSNYGKLIRITASRRVGGGVRRVRTNPLWSSIMADWNTNDYNWQHQRGRFLKNRKLNTIILLPGALYSRVCSIIYLFSVKYCINSERKKNNDFI